MDFSVHSSKIQILKSSLTGIMDMHFFSFIWNISNSEQQNRTIDLLEVKLFEMKNVDRFETPNMIQTLLQAFAKVNIRKFKDPYLTIIYSKIGIYCTI
jgi:hypothetical protein